MRIYIIGICGTFMGGLARLACDLGMQVSGSDTNTYPPMSTQLESLGITLHEGYHADNIDQDADIVVIGNTISRGNPELEHVLSTGMRYSSGAQWLSENVLQGRWVLAVAGTHGKTTTSSLLAWILEENGLSPGYLIGGVPANFGESARLGATPFFVIEADEYDTAFSDKRSKFVHYQPRTLVLNNLEFDHADIFADLAAIQTQFHHLLKIVPDNGLVIENAQSPALSEVIRQGIWSEHTQFGTQQSEWRCSKLCPDASQFTVHHGNDEYIAQWSLIGDHNMQNALAAVAAAHHAGIIVEHAVEALNGFKSVKRRLEKIHDDNEITVFDDFAHHPTAITETLAGLRASVGEQTIIAVLEPRSNTMKQGVHKHLLAQALAEANQSLIFADSTVQWDIKELNDDTTKTYSRTDLLLDDLLQLIQSVPKPCNVLVMSNGGFENLHNRLINNLNQR